MGSTWNITCKIMYFHCPFQYPCDTAEIDHGKPQYQHCRDDISFCFSSHPILLLLIGVSGIKTVSECLAKIKLHIS